MKSGEILVGVLALISIFVASIAIGSLFKVSGNLGELKAEINYIESKVTNLTKTVEAMENIIQNIGMYYNKSIVSLVEKIRILENVTKKLEKDIKNIKQNIRCLNESVNDIKETSESIKDWLLQTIDDTFLKENFPKTYKELYRCEKGDTFNLACFFYLVYTRDNYTYKSDGETDKLFPLWAFAKFKGGDCEDWAFFTIKLIDYLKNKGIQYVKVPKYVNSSSMFVIYRNSTVEVYLENTTEYTIDIYKRKAYVVCYWSTTGNGHCNVALCSKDINGENITEVSNKISKNCVIIEPLSYGAVRFVAPLDDFFVIYYPYQELYEGELTNGFRIIISDGGICYAPNDKYFCIGILPNYR